MSNLETMTIKQLVEAHNNIKGVEPISSWKGRKDLLIEKVSAAMKAARGTRTIREASEALLIEVAYVDDAGKPVGHPYDYVLERVLEEFPEANTTVKCLRWYNTKLNSDPEVKMPVRPRKKVVKQDKPGQASEPEGSVVQASADEETPDETKKEVTADPLA